jgi:hypothetical protein
MINKVLIFLTGLHIIIACIASLQPHTDLNGRQAKLELLFNKAIQFCIKGPLKTELVYLNDFSLKKTDLSIVMDDQVRRFERLLYNRPVRKF